MTNAVVIAILTVAGQLLCVNLTLLRIARALERSKEAT